MTGIEKAREMLRDPRIVEGVREQGRFPLVVVAGRDGDRIRTETYLAVWVRFACSCGARWGAAKLEQDPTPPADQEGKHAGCRR